MGRSDEDAANRALKEAGASAALTENPKIQTTAAKRTIAKPRKIILKSPDTKRGPMLRQSLPKRMCLALLLVVLACGLSGCGKRPKDIDPPVGTDAHSFPQTYPDPATDPKP